MRLLHLAIMLGTGLILQACAGAPAKQPSEERQIARSILDPALFGAELSCPSTAARYCEGTMAPLDCRCVSHESLHKTLGR